MAALSMRTWRITQASCDATMVPNYRSRASGQPAVQRMERKTTMQSRDEKGDRGGSRKADGIQTPSNEMETAAYLCWAQSRHTTCCRDRQKLIRRGALNFHLEGSSRVWIDVGIRSTSIHFPSRGREVPQSGCLVAASICTCTVGKQDVTD